MNPDLRRREFAAADSVDSIELPLADPAGPGDLPPEQLHAWLDRLVDGEVAEPQRQALLSRLERSPDGWRDCALAFLEAQAWREALEPGQVAGVFDGRPNSSRANIPPAGQAAVRVAAPAGVARRPEARVTGRLPWRWGPLMGMVAAAASFTVAFTLGLVAQRHWLSPRLPDGGGASSVVDGSPRSTSGEPAAAAGPKPPKWGTVQFVVDGPGGSPAQVRLPAVESADPLQWLRDQPPAIPDEVAQELRRRGHHVQTQRRYVPVPLDDGRSAVFPFDQVEVRFRGGNGYQ
jgi:hypothetical protein